MPENGQPENERRDDDATVRTREPSSRFTWLKNFKRNVELGNLISIALYIAMLVVGVMNLNECPANDNIPLYLIVTGFMGIAGVIRFCLIEIRKIAIRKGIFSSTETETSLLLLKATTLSVAIVFLLFGTFWVFKVYQPSYDPKDANFCNITLYMFTVVVIGVQWACIAAIIAGYLCIYGMMYFFRDESREPATDVEAPRDTNTASPESAERLTTEAQ